MACRDKRADRRWVIAEDHEKGKTSIENYAYEALSKFHTMIDEIGNRKNKPADLGPKLSDPNDRRSVQPVQPDVSAGADPLIEDFIVSSAGKVVRTIDDLSLELVSLSERNDRFRNRNAALESEIDRLQSMIRISSGSGAEYRGRVGELRRIVVRAERETGLLKSFLENGGSTGEEDRSASYRKRIERLEASISELATKLKNDREAMLAIERPRLSEYLRKIGRLEVCSEGLVRQLSTTGAELRARSCGIESSDTLEYPKIVAGMEKLVKHVSHELKSLKSLPAKIGTRIGGESCVRYLRRMGALEKLVASSLAIIDELTVDSAKFSRRRTAAGGEAEDFRMLADTHRDRLEALEDLAKRLKSGIGGLEIAVASGESANLIRRIRESDRSLRRLRKELSATEKRNGSLSLELSGARIAYDEKVEEVEKLRKRCERAASRLRKRGIDLEREERMESLGRELEEARSRAAEAKILREELDRLRPEVESLRSERAELVDETSRARAGLEQRDERLARMSKEETETARKLAVALEEIDSLRREKSRLNGELERASKRADVAEASTDCRIGSAETEAALKEIERMKRALEETTRDLETTKTELTVSKDELGKSSLENARIDLELSRMKIQNETLVAHLNSEKSTTSETLRNYDKLMMDFRLLKSDIETLTVERSSIRSDLEVALRERNAARAAIEETRLESSSLRSESSNLKKLLERSALDLEVSKAAIEATRAQLESLREERGENSARLDSLARENEDLNDELDRARSEKLDMAGALNDCRLKYEESIDRLNSKTTEAKDLEERLRVAIRDAEEATCREASARLEAARLLEENASLRERIDVSEGAKRSLEETLENLDNEYRAVKNELAVSEKENARLQEESRRLKAKADELMADIEDRRIEEKRASEGNRDLVAELERTRRRLDDFETAGEALRIELSRLRMENESLRSECERVADENERMRLRGGGRKSGESRRSEKESTRLEGESRVAEAEADGPEVGLRRAEREKLCAEIVALRTENCKMRIVLNKLRAASRRLEEQRNLLKITNDLLRGDLEDAKSEIADGEKNAEAYRARIEALMVKLEELKERNRLATREAEEMRSLNERLDLEAVDMKKRLESTRLEDRALRQEIEILRSALKRVNDDNSKRRCDFVESEEELAALKGELSGVREENDSLRKELDARREECCRLESEYGRLERELEELKRARMLDEAEGNELRGEYEKLKALKVELEGKLTDALREIGKYNVATDKLNGLERKLKGLLGDYVATKRLLRSANDEVNHLRRVAETCTRGGGGNVRNNRNSGDAIMVSGV